MGFLITEEQRSELISSSGEGVPQKLGQILSANHARVLDFFRSIDSNFDGCISRGEMAYALNALGLTASPKEVNQLFDLLDPDGNGVVEFHELQEALRKGIRTDARPKPKPLTPAQRERVRQENRDASFEVAEMIWTFERSRGLDDPTERRPPSAVEQRYKDRMARLTEEARKARENKSESRPVERGELMSRMESLCLKSPLIRPQTAPARISLAAASQRRKAAIYDYWLNKHRAEIESHARAVENEYLQEKRMRRDRVNVRRNKQLETLRGKQGARWPPRHVAAAGVD